MRQLPNLLTISRLVASPFVVWLLVEHRFRPALALTLAAGLTDWLDGFAARRLGITGRFGVVLDPLADKVLLEAVFITLAIVRLIPLSLLMLVIARDIVIVVGALLLRIYRDIRRFRPSVSGKVSTFFQVTLVLLVLVLAAYPTRIIYALERTALFLTAFFTVLSGVFYIRKGILMASGRWHGD